MYFFDHFQKKGVLSVPSSVINGNFQRTFPLNTQEAPKKKKKKRIGYDMIGLNDRRK